MTKSRSTIVLSGMMAGDPHQGGATWAVLQYLLGFREMGHDVVFVEPIASERLQPAGSTLENSKNAAYFQQVASQFGLSESSALLLAGTRHTYGLTYDRLREFGRQADLFINISGMLTAPELTERIPARVYLDLDPAFNQLWHAVQGIDMRFEGHTHFVTIGRAIGEPNCPVPTCERRWLKTWQPIVLREWPVAERIVHDGFTTVGNWRGYGSVDYQGQRYGQKAHSLRPLMALPTRTTERFMPALAIHPHETADLEALEVNDWKLLDPCVVAGSPSAYRDFVQGSKAELGIAKSGYVVSRCGWFSDRSVCYLASGRPVLAQETSFSKWLPVGEGLLSFATIDEALAGIDAIHRDYPRHRRAARAIAEEYFDSRKVLSALLDQIGGAA